MNTPLIGNLSGWIGCMRPERNLLFCELTKPVVHDIGDSFEKCSFTHTREQGIFCFPNNLLDHRFLVQVLSTHDASDSKRSETSLYPFLQKHSGDTKVRGHTREEYPTHRIARVRCRVQHPVTLCSQQRRVSTAGGLVASKASQMCNLQIYRASSNHDQLE